MSIQTRFQRRSHRSGVNLKYKNDAAFFSDACKQLGRIKPKRPKKSMQKYENPLLIKPDQTEITPLSNKTTCSLEPEIPVSNLTCHANFLSSTYPRANLFEKLHTLGSVNHHINKCDTSIESQSKESISKNMLFDPSPISLDVLKEDKVLQLPIFADVNLTPQNETTSLYSINHGVERFILEILCNVRNNVVFHVSQNNNRHIHDSNIYDKRLKEQISLKMFESLPMHGDNRLCHIKKLSSAYLDSFLSSIDNCCNDETVNKTTEINIFSKSRGKSLSSSCSSRLHSTQLCSFGDSLFDEGYTSKPLDQQYYCPWPSTDRCLLSSEVENKNFGNIFVVRHQKRPRPEDSQKRRRSYMFSQPPKYITPMEYHNRTMEHIEHMERCRWQNIVKSQDYEGFYHGKSPSKIPEYIYHNETRHALSTNSELLNYMENRLKKFTDDTWKKIEVLAKSSLSPLTELSPFHVDRFFCQFFFFSAGFSGQSRKRKRNYLLKYFKPELYMPHHIYPPPKDKSFVKLLSNAKSEKSADPLVKPSTPCIINVSDNVVKENVPTLPEIPTRACVITSAKSPELRTVENVYSFKKKSLI